MPGRHRGDRVRRSCGRRATFCGRRRAPRKLNTEGMAETVIQAHGLVKRYGGVEGGGGVDLQVNSGEIFGFLGPNGAGKATTISILCTLLTPTAGTARVAGVDDMTDPARLRRPA